MYLILTIASGVGYLTSLVLYGLTLWDIDAQELPLYWPLTFLMFGVWFAAVLKLRAFAKSQVTQRTMQFNPSPILKYMFKGTPLWLIIVTGLSFVFALSSFVALMVAQPGVVSIIEGKRVLHNHGDILKELTSQEYQHALAIEARRSLGHYLLFFGAATAILYPRKAERNAVGAQRMSTFGE